MNAFIRSTSCFLFPLKCHSSLNGQHNQIWQGAQRHQESFPAVSYIYTFLCLGNQIGEKMEHPSNVHKTLIKRAYFLPDSQRTHSHQSRMHEPCQLDAFDSFLSLFKVHYSFTFGNLFTFKPAALMVHLDPLTGNCCWNSQGDWCGNLLRRTIWEMQWSVVPALLLYTDWRE